MGVRAVLRAAQQALPKRITSLFSSDFSGSSISGDVYSTTTKRKWSFLRGTWGISSSKLTTSTASSSYPITVVDALVPDVKIELKDIGQGVGAAIWVTDAGNWWAVASQQESQSCNCSGYYYSCNCGVYYYNSSYTQDCFYYAGGDCRTEECTTQYGNYCSNYYANGNCAGYTKISWQDCICTAWYAASTTCYWTFYPGTYNCCCSESGSGYACDSCYGVSCQTCYPQYMRIIQSAANTVSEILKWQVSNVVKALRVITSNKQITVKSYSDTAMANEIDSKVYNASNAQETSKFGIVVSPSAYNESKTVSEINIERGV
jgi:hypothetical protein